MRKPRDIDAELDALAKRSAALQVEKIRQLGELVVATGADQLDIDMLAGLLLGGVSASVAEKEAYRASGGSFFRKGARAARKAGTDPARSAKSDGGAAAT